MVNITLEQKCFRDKDISLMHKLLLQLRTFFKCLKTDNFTMLTTYVNVKKHFSFVYLDK